MRSFLIRSGVAVALLAILWFFTSRWCALLVDQFYTARLATLQSTALGWNGTSLQFGTGIFDIVVPNGDRVDFTGPEPDYKEVATVTVDAGKQLVFVKDGNSFVLGPRAGTLPDSDKPIPAFAPGPGDTTSVVLERSLLSWPAPFEINFMTGYAPSWQRYIYYRLSWKKPSGAQLYIIWRYRQDYDSVNGWNGQMLKELIRIEIRPAPK
jgi:hypothetical protein